jgi:hypothetical protein
MPATREDSKKIYVTFLPPWSLRHYKIVAFVDGANGHINACFKKDDVSDVVSVVYVHSGCIDVHHSNVSWLTTGWTTKRAWSLVVSLIHIHYWSVVSEIFSHVLSCSRPRHSLYLAASIVEVVWEICLCLRLLAVSAWANSGCSHWAGRVASVVRISDRLCENDHV